MWICVDKNEICVHGELLKNDVWQQSHGRNARSGAISQFIFNYQSLCVLFPSHKSDKIQSAICSYPSFTAEWCPSQRSCGPQQQLMHTSSTETPFALRNPRRFHIYSVFLLDTKTVKLH
jgi:hypothetical protein